jgi:hypothetical protein
VPVAHFSGVAWRRVVSPASLPEGLPEQRAARRRLPCSGSLGRRFPTFPTRGLSLPALGTMLRYDCQEPVSGACGAPSPPPRPCITPLALCPFSPQRLVCEAGASSHRRESFPLRSARLRLLLPKEPMGSPTFPSPPAACLPRSQTPVVSCTLAWSPPGLLPSGHWTPSAFPHYRLRSILWTTTRHISGLHHAADLLVPSSCVLPWLGGHVECTTDLLARLWSGGICTSPVRTHWATTTNFMGSLPIPRFRVYLGTTSAWLGSLARGSRVKARSLIE